MERVMRRRDRLIEDGEVRGIIEAGEHGVLSTYGADGYPYGVPVNYAYDGEKIYFHCAAGEGHKLENIAYNPKVCFTVVGKTEILPDKFGTLYESAIAFGTASRAGNEEKRMALELIIDKYSAEYKENGLKYIDKLIEKTDIFVISVERLTGKARRK